MLGPQSMHARYPHTSQQLQQSDGSAVMNMQHARTVQHAASINLQIAQQLLTVNGYAGATSAPVDIVVTAQPLTLSRLRQLLVWV